MCKRTQQRPAMLKVVASVCTQLNVLRFSNFAQQLPTTRRNNVQHLATGCTLRVCKRTQHVTSNDIRTPRAKSDATLLDITCCVLFHTLLHVVAIFSELLHLFEPSATRTQTTRNIVGTTLSGFVASVCTTHALQEKQKRLVALECNGFPSITETGAVQL